MSLSSIIRAAANMAHDEAPSMLPLACPARQVEEDASDVIDCPVCYDSTTRYVSLVCNDDGVAHNVCFTCFIRHFGGGSRACPQCRAVYTVQEIEVALDSAVTSRGNVLFIRDGNDENADPTDSDFETGADREGDMAEHIIESIRERGSTDISAQQLAQLGYDIEDIYGYLIDYLNELSDLYQHNQSEQVRRLYDAVSGYAGTLYSML